MRRVVAGRTLVGTGAPNRCFSARARRPRSLAPSLHSLTQRSNPNPSTARLPPSHQHTLFIPSASLPTSFVLAALSHFASPLRLLTAHHRMLRTLPLHPVALRLLLIAPPSFFSLLSPFFARLALLSLLPLLRSSLPSACLLLTLNELPLL